MFQTNEAPRHLSQTLPRLLGNFMHRLIGYFTGVLRDQIPQPCFAEPLFYVPIMRARDWGRAANEADKPGCVL